MRRWMAVAAMVALAACGGGDSSSQGAAGDSSVAAASGGGASITGAGSSFAYPIYSKWAYEYEQEKRTKVNYQSVGSGAGIRQFSEGTVDFGGTDAPMTDEELAKAKCHDVMQIPTVLGAVAVTYNLPELQQPVKLDGDVLSQIFMGRITKWNDPKIQALNPGMKLPGQDVLVVHRSDGSGTTFIFTDYLSAVSQAWKNGPGRGKDVSWPVGLGGKGNEGVAGQVKQVPGAVGYVELAYATQNNLPYASLQNQSDNYVLPSLEGATAAAAGVAQGLPANTDFRISVVNAPGAQAYPIASFTWMLVCKNQPDSPKGHELIDFVQWGVTQGQQYAPALQYAPLPDALVSVIQSRIGQVTYGAAATQ